MTKTYIWIWYWVGGGYNSVSAESAPEALRKAQEIGAPRGGFRGLSVAEGTLHVAGRGELEAIDREYASLCD